MNTTSTSIMRNVTNDEYMQLYQEYLRINDIYLTSPNLFSTPPCKMTKEMIDVDFHETKFVMKKPVYANFSEKMEAYAKAKKELLSDYLLEKNKFVHGDHQNRTNIQDLTKKITQVNHDMQLLEQAVKSERNAIDKEINLLSNKVTKNDFESENQFGNISTTNDDILKKTKIRDYLVAKEESKVKNDADKNEKGRLEHFKMIVTDYTISSPQTSTKATTNTTPNPTSTVDAQKTKLKTKLKSKLVKKSDGSKQTKTKTDTEVKKEIKESVKKMVFKTLEECNSTKHSKPYYMSKAKLYELIEKDPELKKKVGKMYKKMTRNELCDNLLS